MATMLNCGLRSKRLTAETRKKKGGPARAWPVAAPMPKSDSFSERRESA